MLIIFPLLCRFILPGQLAVKNDTNEVNHYITLVNEQKLKSPKEALQNFRAGVELAQKINFYAGLGKLYFLAAPLYVQAGAPDSAEFVLKRSIEIAHVHGYPHQEVISLKSLSELYRSIGKFNLALEGFDKLEELSKKAGITEAYALSFSERGVIYWRKNNPVKTLLYIQKAVSILDTLKPKKEFANALTGIALLYNEMKQPDKAREMYLKVIDVYKKIYPGHFAEKDYYSVGADFINIGSSYSSVGDNDSALVYLNRAISIATTYTITKVLALAHKTCGVVHHKTGSYDAGEKHLLKALELYGFLKNQLGRLFVLSDLCALYEKTDNRVKLEACINEAIPIARGIGDDSHLRSLFLQAAVLYEKNKDYEKAYKNRLVYETLNQKLYNSENTQAMNDMMAKYEAEAKEKENVILQKENALSLKTIKQQRTQTLFVICGSVLLLLLIFFILRGIKLQRDNYRLKVKDQEVQLVKLNEMKTLADLKTLQARINPHFLYNALNSITSLIHEKPDQAEEMTIKLSRLFRYSINTQEANWATVKDELIIVQTYLDIEHVRFGNRITFNINADDSLLNIMIPRFLLQPLVENALKHGLKDMNTDGVLSVTLTDKQERIEITVHDNGIPFPSDMMAGYGLQSISDKLTLLCGTAWKMSFINTGVKRICIELPKNSTI